MQWHRYIFAVSGGSAKLYIDGAFAAETTDLTTGPADMGSRLKTYLGKSFYEEDAGFQGALDNVAVYKQALNESEIMQLFGSQRVRGDVSADGKCDIADAVFLQKYLLTLESALPDRQAGDMDENGRLNACDLTLLKRLLMK